MKKTIVLIIAAILLFVILTNVRLIEPLNNELSFDRKPIFKWHGYFDKYEIYIDDNKEFTSPIIKKVNNSFYQPEENLDLGTIYWKVKGLFFSNVWKYNIKSNVAINVDKENDSLNIKNEGNTKLNLTLEELNKSSWGLTGSVILDLDESMILEDKDNRKLSAKQNE